MGGEETLLPAGSISAEYLDQLWEKYTKDPESVGLSWKKYFDSFALSSISQEPASSFVSYLLLDRWRRFGHLAANFNPLLPKDTVPKELSLYACGLTEKDLQRNVPTLGVLPEKNTTVQQFVEALRRIYGGRVGCEFMHNEDNDLQNFVSQELEKTRGEYSLALEQKTILLEELTRAELLESFMHTHFVGQKRFSLEGNETLIPVMKAAIEEFASQGVEEVIIGMAHRGRLNVLSNILNKSYGEIFSEFEESRIPNSFEESGDVKYHKGFMSDATLSSGRKIRLHLCPNPSHLEAVDSVAQGQTRAGQMKKGKSGKVLPLLVHGDAALSGQGIVYEVMQMGRLPGYGNGGTVHFVINNQVGFTTDPEEGRSTRYCTDVAKTFGAVVFHVSCEDPEACIFAAVLAAKVRQRFSIDVFVDLYGYRKYGHNESDEPAFTQPLLYKKVDKRPTIRERYIEFLQQSGVLGKKAAEERETAFKEKLKKEHQSKKLQEIKERLFLEKQLESFNKEREKMLLPVRTRFSKKLLKDIEEAFTLPEGFLPHQKIIQLLQVRQETLQAKRPADWAAGEIIAFGTLLQEGISIRLSGQDSCRGTFSHRHAVIKDQKSGKCWTPLHSLAKGSTYFSVLNSPLSEYGVLGFEYGYSIGDQACLTLWEAQFGDFANGAQVIIDQFLTTAQQKWGQKSKLVLLLPHGYEGQGPEHSSGRIERFLNLSAENNLYVAYPSSPKQLCHLLRRQAYATVPKPLVVFTPKGLLRLPQCVSTIDEICEGSFEEVLDDPHVSKSVEKLVFCSGRIYYDLIKEREEVRAEGVAIVRIEQLYPLHYEKIKALLEKYSAAEKVYWVQDEPENMGMWEYMQPRINGLIGKGKKMEFIGRRRSASPATGSLGLHKEQLRAMMAALFTGANLPTFDASSQRYIQQDKAGKGT